VIKFPTPAAVGKRYSFKCKYQLQGSFTGTVCKAPTMLPAGSIVGAFYHKL